jgi:hypothetical protein
MKFKWDVTSALAGGTRTPANADVTCALDLMGAESGGKINFHGQPANFSGGILPI